MDNITAVAIDGQNVHPYEIVIVTEKKPDFLLNATYVRSEGRSAILYSLDDHVPLTCYTGHAGRQGDMDLTDIFALLTGYIRNLMDARDFLLNTSLISSDPEKGVFVSNKEHGKKVKTIWGIDKVSENAEKICRVAGTLSGLERVMGAGKAMERVIDIIRSENPSLKNCLAATERVCREWTRIVQPSELQLNVR